MALTKDSTGYYLEPTTGQYYSPYTAPVVQSNPYGYMGMGGFQSQPNYAFGGMGGMNSAPAAPEGLLTVDGQSYVPFTGSSAGISQGKRSVVDAMIGGRQPYEYNVPSLASLFPSMQGATQTAAMPQGNAGAGRFMGGLLGAMPTPVSTTTTQAPSSGAGRYL
jgi:hypothetical protein